MQKQLPAFSLPVLLFLLLHVPRGGNAEETCVGPRSLERTTVRISRTTFTTTEGLVYHDYVSGTAWFISPVYLVTVRHVAEALVRNGDTATVELYQINSLRGSGYHVEHMTVRLVRYLSREASDDLALLETERPFPGMQIASVRTEALEGGERVLTVGFPEGRYVYARGKYMGALTFTSNGTANHTRYRFKFYDANNKVVINRGASGSPIFDCSGRVAFTIDSVLTAGNVTHCKDDDPWCTPKTEEFDMPDTPETATNLGVPVVDTQFFTPAKTDVLNR